jgi:hypothetical protein
MMSSSALFAAMRSGVKLNNISFHGLGTPNASIPQSLSVLSSRLPSIAPQESECIARV